MPKCKRHYKDDCPDETCQIEDRLAGDINAARSAAHDNDPSLRSACKVCGVTAMGTRKQLEEWIVDHIKDEHDGSG